MKPPFVLLVNPDDSPYPYESPPLGLFALGSFLEANGQAVEYFDERFDSLERFGALLREAPLAVGFSVLGGRQLESALELSAAAKELSPRSAIVWGGVFPSRLPREALAGSAADFIVCGEGEEVLAELCRALVSGGDYAGIKGLAWRSGAEVRVNPRGAPPPLEKLPFPYSGAAAEYLDLYRRLGPLALGWEASRGCPSSCGFCYSPAFHGPARIKSAAKIKEEAAALARLGPARVDVADDLLAGGSGERMRALCSALKDAGAPWSANLRIDLAEPGLLAELEEAGCRELYFGLESDSDAELERLGKGFRSGEAEAGLAALRGSGQLRKIFSVIAGLPGEKDTASARRLACDLALAHPDSEVQVQSFVPLPETPLYAGAVSAGLVPPSGLKEWARLDHFNSPLPWLADPLEASKAYLSSFFAFRWRTRYLSGLAERAAAWPLKALGLWRMKSGFFGLYAEGLLLRAAFAAAAARSCLRFLAWERPVGWLTFKNLLPLALAAVACAGALLRAWGPSASASLFDKAAQGSFLLAGLPYEGITYEMPLFGLLLSAVFSLGLSPLAVTALLQPALCWLTFAAGRLAGGWLGGTGALAALALLENSGGEYDLEQAFYGFLLLLALTLLLDERRRSSAASAVMSGLSVGISMLARVPLFLFPLCYPLVRALALKEYSRAALLRASLFLAAAYALLLPWGFLNLSAKGEFSIVNKDSASDNVITGALGSVYSLEGDSRALAGLAPGEDAIRFFFRTVLERPADYSAGLARRLWRIFLFQPLLFGAFLAVLLLNRDRTLLPAFSLPVYFVLVHAAFSVEARYFYPMAYVMPPLVLGALAGRMLNGRQPAAPAGRALPAIFLAALAAALASAVLAAAYPARASAVRDQVSELSRFQGDRALQQRRCGLLLKRWGYPAYISCLERYALATGDADAECSISALRLSAPRSAGLPQSHEGPLRCLAARSLRGLELGEAAFAEENFRLARDYYTAHRTMLRGEPYARDKELGARLRAQTQRFWTDYMAPAFDLWPPERRQALLAAAGKQFSLPPGFALPAPQVYRVRQGDAAAAKRLSDRAVEKIKAGDKTGAAGGIEAALRVDPSSAEALMTLCFLQSSRGLPLEAAEACGLAFCSVYTAPARHKPALQALAAEAALQRYAQLRAAGDARTSRAFLRDSAAALPPGWPGSERLRLELGTAGRALAGPAGSPCAGLDYSSAQ